MDVPPLRYGCDTSEMHIVWRSTSQLNVYICCHLKWFWMFSRWPKNSIDVNDKGTTKSILKHISVVGLHFIFFSVVSWVASPLKWYAAIMLHCNHVTISQLVRFIWHACRLQGFTLGLDSKESFPKKSCENLHTAGWRDGDKWQVMKHILTWDPIEYNHRSAKDELSDRKATCYLQILAVNFWLHNPH